LDGTPRPGTLVAIGALEGKVAVITGGASGLGLGTARALVAPGARVGLVDINAEAVQAAAHSLDESAVAIAADTTDRSAITAALDELAASFGRIDVVMANAGVSGWGPVLETEPESWERTVEINLLGTWRTVSAALPHLMRSRGYLLIVASALAAVPGPAGSAYAASKAGVESLGRSLRIELAHHGVGVGVAYYLFVDTPLVAGVESHPGFLRSRQALPRALARTYPLEKAVAATVAGIETRADRVIYPQLLRWMLLVRGALGPLSQRAAVRAMPEIERLAREERRPTT
jgi:NAD(P)-dependent dehydrogenase (short-subunit alcohol dehydrogenase family)